MSEIIECTSCLLTSEMAEIRDHSGRALCDACRDLALSPLDPADLRRQWSEHAEELRANGNRDVLFALSGGKDSVAALHLTVNKHSIRPLAFTIDHGFKSATIMANCQRVVEQLKLDWIVLRVEPGEAEVLRVLAVNGELPCLQCNKTWKTKYFARVVAMTGRTRLLTGGDTPERNRVVLGPKPEWGVQSIGLPLAVESLTEADIYALCAQQNWVDPKVSGWDTDCEAVGPALLNYRKRHGRCHSAEVEHLSQRVRFGLYSKEKAKEMLYERAFTVTPEIMERFV